MQPVPYPRIISGDWHAHERNGRKRMREVSVLLDKVAAIRDTYYAKTLIVTGDLFDRNSPLAVDSIVLLAQFFKTFERTAIVVGNHDTPVRTASRTMLDIFKLAGIEIISDTTVCGNDLFVPYYSSMSQYAQTTFEHVYMHKDIAELNGYVDAEFGIPLTDIPLCTACFNGHLHAASTRELNRGGTYVQLGAPYPTSWSDVAQKNNYVWVATRPNEFGTVATMVTGDETDDAAKDYAFVRSKNERDVTDTAPLAGIAALRDDSLDIGDVLAMTNYGGSVNNIIKSAVSYAVQKVDAIGI